jgi:hypothetical protein
VLEGAAHVVIEVALGVKATAGRVDDRNVSVEGAMVVANNETAGNDLSAKGSLVLASKVEVDSGVPEALKEVLVHMNPIYHGVFVSMYKILVPICFHPIHSKFIYYSFMFMSDV